MWKFTLQNVGHFVNVSMFFSHWGRVTHICVSKQTIIGSDIGLSPGRRQVIIWTNAGILLIGPLGTNFNEILIAIQTFSFKKMHFKISSVEARPFCLGLNVSTQQDSYTWHQTCTLHDIVFNHKMAWPHIFLRRHQSSHCILPPSAILVLRSAYSGRTKPMLWLPMPWIQTWPGYQQPRSWLGETEIVASFNNLRCFLGEKW